MKVLAIKYIQFPLWLLVLISHFLSAELFNFLSKMIKMKSWCWVLRSRSSLIKEKGIPSPTSGNLPTFRRSGVGERKSSPWIGVSVYITRSSGDSPEENFKEWSLKNQNCDTYSDKKVITLFFFFFLAWKTEKWFCLTAMYLSPLECEWRLILSHTGKGLALKWLLQWFWINISSTQSEFFSSECVHSGHFLPRFNWLPINVK